MKIVPGLEPCYVYNNKRSTHFISTIIIIIMNVIVIDHYGK
jgi:hypothetical protein